MGQIAIPSSTASSASNTVKYLKVGTSGGTIYMGEVRVFPSDEDVSNMTTKALTLVAWEDTTFTFTPSSSQTLSYSTDDETTWSTLPSTGIAVSAGQEVRFSGACVPVASSSTVTAETNWGIGRFSSTGKYHVEGNVMSLLGSGWATNKSLQGKSWAFFGLFSGSTTLMSAEHLSLPATTLYSYCYRNMFNRCTNLTAAPELPKAIIYTASYRGMFYNCTKLVKAPSKIESSEGVISTSACTAMFAKCTSLKTAPEIIGNQVNSRGCYQMFSGCTNLINVQKELTPTTLGTYCYNRMFTECSKLVKAPKLPAMDVPSYAYQYMFSACTSLTTAPELPATGFSGSYQYNNMFNGCSNLTKGPSELPAKTIYDGTCRYMFSNCTKLTDSPIIRAENIPDSACTYMFNNCSSLTSITCLAESISTTSTGEATTNFSNGVAASGTFIKDTSMNGWTSGANGIPTGWTVKNSYGDVKYPLTFIARENCTFKFNPNTRQAESSGNTLQYSTDNGVTWSAQPSTGVTVAAGNTVMWRGSCTSKAGGGLADSGIGNFTSTGNFDVEGNTMSLLYNDNFSGQTSLSGKGRPFCRLFSGNTNVVNAENLLLPATNAISCGHYGMFYNCSSLISAPKLSATTLGTYTYDYMFYGCSSLEEAPDLPALEIPPQAYRGMFKNCTSLIKAPKIAATAMTYVVTSESAYAWHCESMFAGCVKLEKGPDLLVKTLGKGAYVNMFNGCTKLKYIKCLATNISPELDASGRIATQDWMVGVATGGTFVKDPEMTGWSRGVDGIPTTWKDSDYLTFVALERTRFRFNYPTSRESTNKLSYSINGGEWVDNLSNTIYTPYLEKGDKIRWKGNCERDDVYGIGRFLSTGKFDVEGNIMSLLYGDNYVGQVNIEMENYLFRGLFMDDKNIVNASGMVLPATTLAAFCYQVMFSGCTSLITAPVLPATTLVLSCYREMFKGCTSLTTAPALLATTLESGCYYGMFNGCTSLTTAPVLPATELTTSCYNYMFSGCTSLNYIKAMFTTTPGTSYTRYWVSGVASTGTFVKNSAATWTTTGTNAVPNGWTIETASS